MFRSRLLGAIVVGCIAMLALMVAVSTLRDAGSASAGVQSPIELHLDCAPGGGIDGDCALASGTSSFDIDVVLKNNSGAPLSISAFRFTIVDSNRQNLTPVVPGACVPPGVDCNPDLNQAGVPGGMGCSPLPSPDTNADGLTNTAESFIVCSTGTPAAPFVADGGSVVLATVHYTSIDGEGTFAIRSARVSDDFGRLMSCNPIITITAECFGALVKVGNVGTNTPTPTPTATATPTATGTPTPFPLTPSVTPTGAVTDVLAINEGTCIAGAYLFGIPSITALVTCQDIDEQAALQDLVHCLRGFDLFGDGVFDCLIPNPDIPPEDPYYPLRSDVILTPVTADFAPLERDADQMHFGITMEIVAFVDGDYPVLFETDRGVIGDSFNASSSSYLCYQRLQDPDCDAAPPVAGDFFTASDHVVAAKLRLTDDTRGPLRVTVTQNGQSVVKTINVVGPPATISVEAIDGKDTIETGATAPTEHGATPLDTACDFPGEQQALTGIASPKKTVLLTKALDSDGNEVVGALISWDHPFSPLPFNPPAAPQGGVVFPLLPLFDLGAAGIGYPQVVCGGSSPGDLVSTLSFDGTFDVPADPGYSRTFTVHVVDSLPTVTATPTSTPTPVPTETATPVGVATATPTATPAPTETATPSPAMTATDTPAATGTPTPVPTATNTPMAIAGSATIVATRTVKATGTALATTTVVGTATVVGTTTAVGTPTLTPTASATHTAVPTATNTPVATATNTPVATATNTSGPTATPTGASTASPTAVSASSTPNATKTAAAAQTAASGTRTPIPVSPTAAAAPGSPTRQSSVLGAQLTPRPTGIVLPATGDGGGRDGFAWGIGMLAIAGVAVLAGMLAFPARRRRR